MFEIAGNSGEVQVGPPKGLTLDGRLIEAPLCAQFASHEMNVFF
jgi:hypothetical protein